MSRKSRNRGVVAPQEPSSDGAPASPEEDDGTEEVPSDAVHVDPDGAEHLDPDGAVHVDIQE